MVIWASLLSGLRNTNTTQRRIIATLNRTRGDCIDLIDIFNGFLFLWFGRSPSFRETLVSACALCSAFISKVWQTPSRLTCIFQQRCLSSDNALRMPGSHEHFLSPKEIASPQYRLSESGRLAQRAAVEAEKRKSYDDAFQNRSNFDYDLLARLIELPLLLSLYSAFSAHARRELGFSSLYGPRSEDV